MNTSGCFRHIAQWFFLLSICVGAPGPGSAASLEEFVFGKKWFAPEEADFVAQNPELKFQWTTPEKGGDSKESDTAREFAVSREPGKFLDEQVVRAQVYCAAGRVRGLILDFTKQAAKEGAADAQGGEAQVQRLAAALEKKLGMKPDHVAQGQRHLYQWRSGETNFMLQGQSLTAKMDGKTVTIQRTVLFVRPALDVLVFNADFWKMPGGRFAEQNRAFGFEWTSARRDSARSPQPGQFLGFNIPEAIVRVEQDKLTGVALSIYNKGDSGAGKYQSDKVFDAFVQTVQQALEERLGSKAAPRSQDAANVARAKGLQWSTKESQFLLEWSETRENRSRNIPYQAEFLRLLVLPVNQTPEGPSRTWRGTDHLKDEDDGTKFIFDVPMVDQGAKGYCAVAVAERILRYYGMDVDQHEVAKLAGTSAAGGTSIMELGSALKGISAKLKLRTRTLVDMNDRFVRDIFDDYNRLARRKKLEQLDPLTPWPMLLDAEVLKESRGRDKAALARFERHIITHIDQGKPLLWCVFLGWAREPKLLPQTRGGHMRIIIGYNAKTKTVLFSDSWGAGHEKKAMPLEDAWTLTLGLTVMEM